MNITKKISVGLALLMCITMFVPANAANKDCFIKSIEASYEVPEGYTGIDSVKELNAIRDNLDGKYILTNDIDVASISDWAPIGSDAEPFTGIFDGNGYSVQNLKINIYSDTTDSYYVGLFGAIDNAIVANVCIENADFMIDYPYETSYPTGIVAGFCSDSKILNCSSSGKIESTLGGGFDVGGIVGIVYGTNGSLVENCVSSAHISIIGKDEGSFNFPMGHLTIVGGIAGTVYENNIVSKCFYKGNINIQPLYNARTGGIVGAAHNNAPVIDCANTGDIYVNGLGYAGGICGVSHTIENCYNSGDVVLAENDYSKIGGIAAYTEFNVNPRSRTINDTEATVSNCYYSNALGAAISNANEEELENVKALSLDEMKSQESYIGFDFDSTWAIKKNSTPTLQSTSTAIPSKIEILPGEKYYLPIEVIYIETSNSKIASVESNGIINGVEGGTTSIEVVTVEGKLEVIEISVLKDNDSNPSIFKRFIEFMISFLSSLFNFSNSI